MLAFAPTWRRSNRSRVDPETRWTWPKLLSICVSRRSRFITGAELVVDGGWCVSEGTLSEDDPRASQGHERTIAMRCLSIWPQFARAVDAIEATQLPAIRAAAARFADAILKGRLVHVFGTGHSRMAVEEMFPRYGSFPGFHPIVELSMTYHNPVVGANGQRQAMFLENVQGFGPVLWRNFATSPDDVLLAISTSGCNAVTIDVAVEAIRLGMSVVAVTSFQHARVSTSRHESGKKLHELADGGDRPACSSRRFGGLDRRASRRRLRRYRASPAARSSTCSRQKSPAC